MATGKISHSKTKRFTSDSPSIQEILDYKKPMEAQCEILVDPELQVMVEALQDELIQMQRAERTGKASLADRSVSQIEEEIHQIYVNGADALVTFKFRAIGRKRLDELAREHPPSKEQQDAYRKLGQPGALEFDPDTFGAYLIAESCYEPAMDITQAKAIWENWSKGETEELFGTALKACMGRASLPFSKRGTAKT